MFVLYYKLLNKGKDIANNDTQKNKYYKLEN